MLDLRQHTVLLNTASNGRCAERQSLGNRVGQVLASMHDGSLVHGDLTTSNMLVRESNQAVVGPVLMPIPNNEDRQAYFTMLY